MVLQTSSAHFLVPSYHDVGVCCELINVCSETGILDLHSLELRLSLSTTQLELLDNVGDLFKAMGIKMRCSGQVFWRHMG